MTDTPHISKKGGTRREAIANRRARLRALPPFRRRRLLLRRAKYLARRTMMWCIALIWLVPLAMGTMHSCREMFKGRGAGDADKYAARNEASPAVAFSHPAIPGALTDPQARADYAALHWWDCLDLGDSTLMATAADSATVEQAAVDWLDILRHTTPGGMQQAIGRIVRETANNKDMYYHLNYLADRYLFDPNSPMRDEELYDRVLHCIEVAPGTDEVDKIRPRSLRKQIAMNRPGTLTADFAYEMPDGKRSLMSAIRADYTIIYFYNPDCEDCRLVREQMECSPVISVMINEGTLRILALYPDEDITAWKNYHANIPTSWINARDPRGVVDGELYALRATPTLYLLDKDKTVILKDASPDRVETLLMQLYNPEIHNNTSTL